MVLEKDNILEFNQYMKSDKMPYNIYAEIESLVKKVDGCANEPENSSTTKIDEHIPYGYLMSTIWDLSILYIVGKTVWKSFVLLYKNMVQL